MYADDTTLYFNVNQNVNADAINGEVLKFNQWLAASILSLNVSKLNLWLCVTDLSHTLSFKLMAMKSNVQPSLTFWVQSNFIEVMHRTNNVDLCDNLAILCGMDMNITL